MVFKSKLFFSLKKSKSSGGTSNSPIGSDSPKEETRIPNRSLSSRLGSSSKKKKKKNGSSSSGDKTLPPTSEEKRPSVASFLGFNRIKTRSSSLSLEICSSSGNHNAVTVRRGSGSDSVTSGSRSGSGLEVSPSCSDPVGSLELENLCELVNSRKRFTGDIKSYSHELNSNGLRDFPIRKPRGLNNLEELVKLIRTKFDKEKELVNLELIVFSWDLVASLDSQHEFQRQIEDLLVLARKCVETTPRDFWVQCEDIVQDLDDRRKELSPGVLKRLHTRILFILSRCTRLLKFHKERCEKEVGQLRQSRVLHLHSTDKKSAVSKEQNDSKVKPVKVVKNRVASGKEKLIICRICEEDVSASNVEDHSRICAFADKYDLKYASVDEHLVAVAVTLEKIIEKFKQKDSLAAVESPDGMKISNASLAEESDVLSPKLSDWSQRGSFDMLDYILEPDNSAFMDQGMATSSAGSMTPKSPIPTPRPDPIELLLFGGRFHEKDDIPQMSKLPEIATRAANVILDSDDSTYKLLLSCLRDLRDVLDCRFFDALIVETFGTRIEMFIEQKYLQLCNIVDDEKVDLSSTVIDEDAPLEDGIVRSLRTSQVHPWDGISIDDFQIQKEISRGAYGRVVLAKKRTTGDIFAIKILKKADMIRKKAVESTLAERDILINIRSPFVVRFFYSFTCPKKLYLVMEYVNGGDFYSLLKNYKCLDESNARVYIAEIVRALEDLHSKGVVHHDLKPDNLLIARNGHVKLTDFGVSKVGVINSTDDISGPVLSETSLLVEENPSEHQLDGRVNESMKGTPDYLAPEILSGTEHGAAVDWWSAGIVLFELIVGVPPFHANNPEQIFENIRNGNITWPRVPEEMSHEARDLIYRLLTKDPKQRLGARGAAEVKQHIFFEGINWDTLAEQEPVFVPNIQDDLDTSFFESRYSSNPSDKGVDESDILAEFEDSFNRFSVKNLAGLAHLNRDMIAS